MSCCQKLREEGRWYDCETREGGRRKSVICNDFIFKIEHATDLYTVLFMGGFKCLKEPDSGRFFFLSKPRGPLSTIPGRGRLLFLFYVSWLNKLNS